MQVLDAEATRSALGYRELVAAIREVLDRHRHGIAVAAPRGVMDLPEDGILLINPAHDGEIAATKLVTVHPRNGARDLPTIQGQMLILDAPTGRPLGVVDGGMVSARRTAAVSLLAARHLAPVRDTAMLVYGAGTQARVHIEAFHEGLGIRRAYVHSRTRARAQELAAYASGIGVETSVAEDPADVLAEARILVGATTATSPILPETLPEDTFVAAVGAYRPQNAELPAALVQRASLVVDTLDGVRHEAGDLIAAAEAGALDWSRVLTLEQVDAEPRSLPGPVIFKSVGHSLWDLAAARVLGKELERSA